MKLLIEYFKFLLSTLLGLSLPLVLLALYVKFSENTDAAFGFSLAVFVVGFVVALPASFVWFLFYQVTKPKFGSNFLNLFFSGIATIFVIGVAQGFSGSNMFGAVSTMFMLGLPFGIVSALIYWFLFGRKSHNQVRHSDALPRARC